MDAAQPHTYTDIPAQTEEVSQDEDQRYMYTKEGFLRGRRESWEDAVYDDGKRVAGKEATLIKLGKRLMDNGEGLIEHEERLKERQA